MMSTCLSSHLRLCQRHARLTRILLQLTPAVQKTSSVNLSSKADPKPVQLAYRIHEGHSMKKPVIILHGMLGNGRNWDIIGKQLAEQTKKSVITVDNRNHGDSEHADDMSFEAMSVDIVNLLTNELKQESCSLIGHSLGGRIAMTLALSRPDLVEKFVSVDISPTHRKVNTSVGEVYQFILAMQSTPMDDSLSLYESRKKAAAYLEPTIQDPNIRGFILTNLVKENGKVGWRINLNAIIKNFKHLGSIPTNDSVYNGPALFIGGTKSDYIQPENQTDIFGLFPKAEVSFLDGDHFSFMFNQEGLTDLVSDFIMKENKD